ncbi:FadR/GntR family transcriptional regulator [Anaeromicropila populeti]|uniref:GntR family transcriptional regulator, transcriptional repressor for pyruvate dehydrogenase complex n=1 Tax=Anaeromicropila populeti TaxID=37658 RepID=A0A1I6HLR2_9FIRM|nr:FadR/GntR family transcriptional regulator [Anaeromicropila populeti]SFR55413.1 GntR family transcriptional regulator, transcriptional repressor for pyruvate dehydrogenase complex [Anaeromicropila populeti]
MAELLYEKIAGEIEERIRSGELQVNAKLPSERAMAEQYGVSRTVIREALKVLNEKGLVEIMTCRGGYVTQPDQRDLMSKFENAVDSSNVNPFDILDARIAIETAVGKRVIERAAASDILKLKLIYSQMESALEDSREFSQYDAQFHLQLAACSGNEVLVLITTTLNNLTDRSDYLGSTGGSEIRLHAQKEHKEMICAVEERNIEKFEQAMESHIECIRRRIMEHRNEL